jgi:hypothetical protein
LNALTCATRSPRRAAPRDDIKNIVITRSDSDEAIPKPRTRRVTLRLATTSKTSCHCEERQRRSNPEAFDAPRHLASASPHLALRPSSLRHFVTSHFVTPQFVTSHFVTPHFVTPSLHHHTTPSPQLISLPAVPPTP